MIDEKYISDIVENVIKSIKPNIPATHQKGVFPTMTEALEAVSKAYVEFKKYSVAQREKMIQKIREYTLAEAAVMAEMGVVLNVSKYSYTEKA